MPPAGAARSIKSTAVAWLGGLLLIVAVLGGGGRGGLGDILAQMVALWLLLYLFWLGSGNALSWRTSKWVRWLPVLALVLPVIQLIPVPMALWTISPARAELAGQLAQVGVSPIQVISLNPSATEQALWSLLPAAALFLATLTLSRKAQLALLAVIVVLAALSVFMGMAQLAQGNDSPLRLYSPTNRDQAVGFYANRNHFAGMLAMTLPLVFAGTAWVIAERLAGRWVSPLLAIAGCGMVILIILGIAMSRSRAGMLLGMLAVLTSLPLLMGLRRQRGTKRILAITLAIAGMLSVQFSLLGIFQRLEADPMSDGRWEYAKVTLTAASAYAPLGSGLGTFQQAYQPFEAKRTPGRYIINHAHDDYLELWLEGGVPALILMGIAASAWLWRGKQLLRSGLRASESQSRTLLLGRVAWLSASLGLLHSALDFPLRTTASMAVFAVLAAVAFSSTQRQSAPSTEMVNSSDP